MAKKTETKSKPNIAIAPNDSGVPVQVMKLSQIFCDKTWNPRSDVAPTEDDNDNARTRLEGGSGGFMGLVWGLGTEPQREPIDIRPNPDAGKGKPGSEEGRPYKVMAGHQRYLAKKGLAAGEFDDYLKKEGMAITDVDKLHTLEPTILVRVHPAMSEADAFEFSVKENSLRSNLTIPDLCYSVKRILEGNPDRSDRDIGHIINKSGQFATSLRMILLGIEKMPAGVKKSDDIKDAGLKTVKAKGPGGKEMPILQAWREGDIKPTYKEMLSVAKADPDKRASAFEQVVKQRGGSTGDGDTDSSVPNWVPGALEAAKHIGAMLAKCDMAHVLSFELDDIADNPETVALLMVGANKDLGSAKKRGKETKDVEAWETYMRSVGEAIVKAYNETVTKDKEEKKKARDAAAAESAKNGQPAAANA